MGVRISRFFDSVGDDRVYQSEEFADYFRSFITDGIFNGGSQLKVTPTGSGMAVNVDLGRAWVQGYLFIHKDDGSGQAQLDIDAAGAQPRIDRVVIRLDRSAAVRDIDFKILKGTQAATPVPPTLTREGNIYELSLAQIKVKVGALKIDAADVIDERLNQAVCGLVNSLITLDTATFAAEIEAFWDSISTQGYLAADAAAVDSNMLGGELPSFYAASNALATHTGNTDNPHSVTKAQVGLSNVANVKAIPDTDRYTFAASSHTHTVTNITGLQTALNGKANSSHTHSYAASSHKHTIANITSLQTTLNGKANSSHTHTVANISDLHPVLYGTGVPSSLQPRQIYVRY